MEHDQNREVFQYTYSAREQEELQKIRSKYIPREESKLEQLHRLDAGVTRRAAMPAVTTGLSGTLILGLGMSLAMTDVGAAAGLGSIAMPLGIIVGIAGLILIAAAYPLYLRVLKKERGKIASRILQLTDELMTQL